MIRAHRSARARATGPAAVIRAAAAGLALVTAAAAAGCSRTAASRDPAARDAAVPQVAYAARAAQAARLLEGTFYNGTGLWHMCVPRLCNTKNRDWGADSLTEALYLRWRLTGDTSMLPLMRVLVTTAHRYRPGETGSSDTAAWDAVADVREYQVTGRRMALVKAEAAVRWVTSTRGFAAGACPGIDYQWSGGRPMPLKTLETQSNLIKADLLLYQVTRKRQYLRQAESNYAAVRRYYLSAPAALYTAYVFDTGRPCTAVPGRYLASVNGNMIWSGTELASLTGRGRYLRQAIGTARAVQRKLSDGAGVYADLQADTDIVEPLIEAMYDLATQRHQQFARAWLLAAASAAGSDVTAAGAYGRFFDGPPPSGPVTAWQTNGGIALMQAAAALDPAGLPADPGFWSRASYVPDDQRLAGPPVRLAFTGRAIAIMGTLGDLCCQAGHARVLIDGRPTADGTGIWQDKSSAARKLGNEVLLAWRWRVPGRHVIEILPGIFNQLEGGPYFPMTGYYLVR